MFKNVKISTLITFLIVVVYKLILDISYVTILQPIYSYSGFYINYSIFTIVVGWIMVLPILVTIPYSYKSPADTILFLTVIIAFIPVITLYSYGGENFLFTTIHLFFWLIVCVLYKVLPNVKIPILSNKVRKIVFYSIIILICSYCAFYIIKDFGFKISFELLKVYNQREIYKATNIPFSKYFFNWAANVIIPASIMYFILQKKYIYIIPLLIVQMLLFTATGMKTMFFVLLFILIFTLIKKAKKQILIVGLLFLVALIFTVVFYNVTKSVIPYSLFARRMLIIPAKISFYYYDIFKQHGALNLSQGFFSWLFGYRFSVSPALLIGRLYMGTDTFANNGVVSDGLINFGLIGCVTWAVVLVVFLKLINMVSRKDTKIVAVAGFAMFTTVFSNSALFTAILTHGLLPAYIFIYFLPDMNTKFREKKH